MLLLRHAQNALVIVNRTMKSEIFEKNLFYLAFEGKIWVSEAFTNVRTTGLFTNEVCNWAL